MPGDYLKREREIINDSSEIASETLSEAEKLAGLAFTKSERDLMLKGVIKRQDDYAKLRDVSLANSVPRHCNSPQFASLSFCYLP